MERKIGKLKGGYGGRKGKAGVEERKRENMMGGWKGRDGGGLIGEGGEGKVSKICNFKKERSVLKAKVTSKLAINWVKVIQTNFEFPQT